MAIYYRTIKIDGVTYKQISPTQWQNLNTGQILDNTKITVIVNEFKSRQAITVPTVPTGACCTGGTCFGGGQATPSECSSAGGVFYAGSSCFVCDSGVYCTGSGVGQTCFGLGHRGQSLTNNFIVGGSCSSCILGACCTGGTCLGGGITNQAACIAAGGLFYPGSTCTKCDFGVYCTGSNCLSLGYRGEQLTNNFIVGGTCAACIIGACCETVNGVMQCSEKSQQECSNGCFKGAGSTCGEASSACSTCVHCCFAGGTCTARTPEACLQAGGTYFAFGQGCTSCRYGVCSSDTVITQRFFGNGCTGTFIVGGVPSDLDFGVFCTGSGVGQTCAASGYRYQQITNNFIAGASCSSCILGACCTGGGCLGGGLTSQAACAVVGGLFYPGATCAQCDVGVFCTGLTTNRTCIRTGYRGEALSNQFQVGATCAYCITGTCCVNGNVSFGDSVRQSNCTGRFFPNQFLSDACEIGSCCLGAACTENVYKYDCFGTFNFGMTCMACSNGACCLPAGGGCTLATFASCFAQGGTFFGGATCAACDQGSCCHGGNCNNQRRGNACLGSFYANQLCDTDPCVIGACCVGNTCAGINFSRAECNIVGGDFHSGSTCIGCFTGANCISPENPSEFIDRDCAIISYGTYLTTDPNGYFGFGKTCADCEIGSCCNPLQEGGGGTIVIRGSCSTSSGYNFFKGQTLIACDTGVYCTGASLGQTCFGLGYRGQSLTSNFIIGGNCNDCVLGSCCTGGTCLAGGLTSQSACNLLGGIFFGGRTCDVCQYGVYCTGATCFGLGYRGQSLTNNFIAGASCSSCILGACCTGGTCLGGGQTSQAACSSPAINGLFYPGTTCRSCDYGIYCTGATCFDFGYRAQVLTNNFIAGASCSSCILGACCTGGTCLGGGQTSQAACVIAGGTFYPGSTCFACVNGVYCTGSGVGQTCFGLGHRGQSLTNNFIAGASCSSCILGACCTGGGCLGNGLTNQAACSAVGGLFYPGTTCISCDYGVYCTGSNENTSCLGLGYRAQNLSNQFVIAGDCLMDCTYGSCCQGTTCLGITNQGNCPKPNAFFEGSTCFACDTGLGACCTGGSSSITTVSGCQAIGGIFFPAGTTALCITGSCCTGGTCTQEFTGRSSSCQLFIAGATCSICDSGVFCTGSTCFGLGFRGQSLTSNFIAGATCPSCVLGICCTGGTCFGGGQTAQINCPSSVGTFIPGATLCSACLVKVNCCLPGATCSYILREQCLAQSGIVFEGAEDCTLCDLGAFCTGNTCAGITLKGFNITDNFNAEPNCDVCITGVCCDDSYKGTITSKFLCKDTFYPGTTNTDICTQGKTFGICCNATTNQCTEDVEQSDCSGYFISNEVSVQNGIYCSSNPCQYGACCGQNSVTSITGGVCLGIMRRAECALTGGEFFAASDGYTCSNCIYTPMLGSALFNQIASSDTATSFKTTLRLKDKTGWTGNEIQPRLETAIGSESNTWLTWNNSPRFYQSVNITTGVSGPVAFIKDGGYMSFSYLNLRYTSTTPFRTWYGVTLSTAAGYGNGASANWQGRTGFFDYSPIFESGITRQIGFSFGYIDGGTLESPRYMRMVFGYSDIESPYNNKTMVFRYSHTTSGARRFSRTDATRHAMLDPSLYNLDIANPDDPFANSSGSNIYATPVLVQFFGENPLSRRIRPMGSCCKGRTCMGIVTQDHCTFIGGTFNVNANCARCYPDLIFGNCCTGGIHGGYTSLSNCNRISGTFFEGTTFDSEPCKVGIICNANRTCYEGISYSYYGDFSSVDNKFFVEGDYRNTVGCAACDAGICCTGGTCLGLFPRTICEATGGKTTYLNTCGTEFNNCELGVCCPFEGGCGKYTSRGECTGGANIFIGGATLGATCSACNSLMKLTEYTPGVTYTFVFNKGTTYGRFFDGSLWVQETDNLRIRSVKINYVGMTAGDPGYTFYANTVMSNMIVHPTGYRGTLYAHGAVKNLQPFFYVDNVKGIVRDDSEPFTSLSYEDYNSGWKGPKTPGATEKAANYTQFNLPRFLEMKNQLDNDGVTLSQGDTFLVNTTNFNPYREETTWKSYTTGYPYQLFYRRANTLTYGIINCVGATTAAFINSIGSTLCFRPPTTWPLNDKENKPIFKLSDLEGRIPGQTGIPLVTLASSTVDKDFTLAGAYPLSDKIASSFTQVSEYGGGQNYGTTTPIWSMFGARSTSSSYGDQYLAGINRLHQIAYATGPAYFNKDEGVTCNPRVSIAQRKDMIARIVQYGIDSWGAQRAFTVLGAGAGQKSARTRPWVSIAGYYLGVTAMYDPEATMLQDTERMQKWSEYLFTDEVTCSPKTDCVTDAEWRRWRIGGSTGSDGNFKGLRRQLAQWNENAALTTYEYTNNPNNPILHYDYVGRAYRLGFKDHSPTGLTGITFYNEIGITRQISERIKVNGNFGVIRWGSETGATTIHKDRRNPFISLPYYDYDQKGGVPGVFTNTWLRVVTGPGSSGGQGSRYYRIIQMNPGGFMHGNSEDTDSRPMPTTGYPSGPGGGYQIVIGQTWADGIPDHTSHIQIYPFIESDFGITRPCLHCATGFTSGTIPGYITVGNPDGNCGVTFAGMPDCMLWDASAGVGLYYSTAVSGWINTFYFLKHIMVTKGITLVSDAFPVTDYMDMRFYTSPYNLFSFDQLEAGSTNNSVLASWMPQGIYNPVEITKRINFAKYFPGIRKFIYGEQDPITIW